MAPAAGSLNWVHRYFRACPSGLCPLNALRGFVVVFIFFSPPKKAKISVLSIGWNLISL